MTAAQAAWWRQAESDFEMFELLVRNGAPVCHRLHFLQMAAEKLAKAYIVRSGRPAPLSHAAFQLFLRHLADGGKGETARLAAVFGIGSAAGLRAFLRQTGPLARELEKLAPDLAGDGPNPEYPWPHADPTTAPVHFAFPLWRSLENETRGRRLLDFLRTAVRRFPDYA